MSIRTTILLLILIPIIGAGWFVVASWPMNAAVVAVLGAIVIYLAYNFYARRIDRDVIQPDPKKATPARLYMDGVDFMPTNRNILYGYHFKSVAAAGPIVGVIAATNLWGWLPALLWLTLGVSFIGWASDYSAIMVAVRNDGNSLTAIAHRLIAPRTRIILFLFIFFYLLLMGGAFIGILAGILDPRADVPFGIFMLAVMGLLTGQMLYRWKLDLIVVTLLSVIITLGSMALGAQGMASRKGVGPDGKPAAALVYAGPVNSAVSRLNDGINRITGNKPLYTVTDPTKADPRLTATTVTPDGKVVPKYTDAGGNVKMLPSFIFWCMFLFAFSYLGTILPIWRFAQPVNYIGFWVTFLTIGLSALGALVGGVRGMFGNVELMKAVTFQSPMFAGWMPMMQVKDAAGNIIQSAPAIQPIWPMLFVTIACGAISGWHALFGSVGTARQLEYETDALPVGGGAMFTENVLALLSLMAVSIVGTGAGGGRFALGIGELLHAATFGLLPVVYGTALGFGAFVVIVLTVTQLVFRVMRVTLTEWVGEKVPVARNMHVSTLFSMLLSLLVVTVWLRSVKRNPAFALYPMLFMYITTIAATVVTGYNLYVLTLTPNVAAISVIGAWGMIIIAVLLIVAALLIGWDGWKAYQRLSKGEKPTTAPAPVAGG